MSAQPAIPSGRPQPKLSKLVTEQSLTGPVAPKFVFWDLQKTPLPAGYCVPPFAVLESLMKDLRGSRLTVVTEVPTSKQPGACLLKALKSTRGVELLTFLRASNQTTLETAADYELKRVQTSVTIGNCYSFRIILLILIIHSECTLIYSADAMHES